MLISFDLETHLIAPGNLTPKPVVGAWFNELDEEPVLLLPDASANNLRWALERAEYTFVGHNISYDMAVMGFHYPDLMPLIFRAYAEDRVRDTMVLQKLIDIAAGCHDLPRSDGTRGYSLADLQYHHFGQNRFEEKSAPDAWRLRYAELDGVPLESWPPAAKEYALADATGTLAVYQQQRKRYGDVAGEGLNVRAAWALHLQSIQGVRTDGPAVEALEARLITESAEAQALLRKPLPSDPSRSRFLQPTPLSKAERDAGKAPEFYLPPARGKTAPRPGRWAKDVSSIRAAVEAAYATLGAPVPLTEGGATATDGDTVDRVEHLDPELKALNSVAGNQKLLTAFVPVLKSGTKTPIQPRWNVLVKTGRTSCREPNLQQLPKAPGVRDCFVPSSPENVFVSVDYDCAEIRSHAQVLLRLFGKSKLAEFFQVNPTGDPHTMFAARTLGISYEEGLRLKDAGDKRLKNARDFGKVGNFGLPGGLGVDSTIEYARANYGIVLTREEAQQLKTAWLRTWPEMENYFDWVSRLVGEGGATIKSFGVGMVAGDKGYCDTANFFFQSLTAEGAKDALFHVAWECYVDRATALFGVRPFAFVHDEIVAEGPRETLDAWGRRLATVWCERMRLVLPDIPVTASPAAMVKWQKKAEPTYDSEGKLVPWTPPTSAYVAS